MVHPNNESQPTARQVFQGIGIGRLSVYGPVIRFIDEEIGLDSYEAGSPSEEWERAQKALAEVQRELSDKADQQDGLVRDILRAQALMAQDPDLLEDVEATIDDGVLAPEAIERAFALFQELLQDAGEHFAARSADIADVARRARAKCLGAELPGLPPDPGHPYILLATDLAPADTAELDLERVLGFVTAEGGPTSHTAILARARGIPAVVGCPESTQISDGEEIIIDTLHGNVVVSPTLEELQRVDAARKARAQSATSGPGKTRDGHRVQLLANIGGVSDAKTAMSLGAEGVGLLRTEFLFLGRDDAPSFEEQRDTYQEIFAALGGKKVVARVLDAGADKPLDFLNPGNEPNPALGLRGLRALRSHLDVLEVQLSALAAAAEATSADLWVMAPMVADADEARWFAQAATRKNLNTVGVMIEIPSAALTAEHILQAVDFVSIGTNDLAQYTLAADRMLGAVGAFLDPWHPAVLRLVKEAADAGAKLEKPVGVCGEAAADPLLACALIGVGVSSLSMSPIAIEEVRAVLAETSLAACRTIAATILRSATAQEARTAVADLSPQILD